MNPSLNVILKCNHKVYEDNQEEFFLNYYYYYYFYDIHREREAETQAEGKAGSMHQEPDTGLDPGLQDRALGQKQAPNRCATRTVLVFLFV